MSVKLKGLLLLAVLTGLGLAGFAAFPPSASAAACAPTTDYGTVTQTVSIPAASTYRVWSRIMAPDATNNSYFLEIDGNTCYVVGDSAITANTWTWVDYQNGATATKNNATLTAGNHTVKMIGREAGVKLDRVVFTADTACVPTGTGDNCASPPDTTAPSLVAISAPAGGATISGNTTVSANATDDVGIAKVEFYVDGALSNTDTSSPYGYTLNAATLSVGSHTLTAKGYDAAGNVTTSAAVSVTVADTTAPTAVSVTAPAAGSTLSGTATMSATASDNVGVTKMEFYVDGALKATDTSSPFSTSIDTTTLTNATHSLTAKAYDAANNSATSPAVSVTVNNVVTPPPDTTQPNVTMNSPTAGITISGTYAVAATASDNVGVTKVEFYVDGTLKNTDTSTPFGFNLDTTTLTNASHSFTAKAYDAANNNRTSVAVSATVNNVTFIGEDVNQDGKVDIFDISNVIGKYGQTGTSTTLGRADVNGDGKVDIFDISRVIGKYGTI